MRGTEPETSGDDGRKTRQASHLAGCGLGMDAPRITSWLILAEKLANYLGEEVDHGGAQDHLSAIS